MAQGIYGTTIPANIDPENDVEIWYNYRQSRTSDSANTSEYKQISSSCLVKVTSPAQEYISSNILEGMYTLKLPLTEFSEKGYYSIYIKPKEIPVTISDVSSLNTYGDVKGIVLDANQLSDPSVQTLALTNNSLVGYRVVYIKNGKRQDDVRIITSNNRCEPMVQSSGVKTSVYRYNDNSSMVFITVTPSTAPSFKPNAAPYIGTSGQRILLINTKFEPIHIDLELVENDADTLATLIAGDQLSNLDKGLITTFNSDSEIFKQQEVYELKEQSTGKPIYHIRKNRENIDFTEQLPTQ